MYLQYRKTIAQKAHEWIMYWHDYDSLLESTLPAALLQTNLVQNLTEYARFYECKR